MAPVVFLVKKVFLILRKKNLLQF